MFDIDGEIARLEAERPESQHCITAGNFAPTQRISIEVTVHLPIVERDGGPVTREEEQQRIGDALKAAMRDLGYNPRQVPIL